MPILNNKGCLPLTSAQLGMWFANEISPNQGNNNISEYIIIDGSIDSDLFIFAIHQTIIDTESLHSRFVYVNNEVKQCLENVDDYQVMFNDLSKEPCPEAASNEYIKAHSFRTFTLTKGRAFECSLLKLSSTKFILYYCCHHILQDGFGGALFYNRIVDIYNAMIAGETIPPKPFGSFRKLIEEDIGYRNSSRFIRDRDYWLSHFNDLPEAASLAGRAASVEQLITHRKNIDKKTDNAIREQAKALGYTLPQLLTTLSCIYIYRMTNNEDLVIGMPVTARVGQELRTIPGLLSNILPLRISLSPDLTLMDVLKSTAREMGNVLRHQQYRNDDLRRELNSPQALFHTTVNIELFGKDVRVNGCPTIPINLCNGPADDLNMFFFGYGDEHTLVLGFDANAALYTQDKLLSHHHRMILLFNQLLERPHDPIGLASLQQPIEARHLAALNAQTRTTVTELALPELFEAQVLKTPDSAALLQGESSLSYAQLNTRANQLSNYLLSLGISAGDGVAVLLPRGADLIISLLAIAKAGATYLPLDPDHPPDRLWHCLTTAEPKLILTSSTTSTLVDWPAQKQIDEADTLAAIRAQCGDNLQRREPWQAAYILFTSGSTGKPKGVMVSHCGLSNFLTAMQQHLMFSAGHRMLATTTIGFDIAVLEIFLPLVNGAAVAMVSRDVARDPTLLAQEIATRHVTHLQGTPALWQGLTDYQPQSVRGLTALVGGDALPARLAESMVALASRVIQVYGPTETTVWSTLGELTPENAQPGFIGRPVNNTQVYILDSALQPVPAGQPGELYIAGDGLAFGYLRRPDLTSERFVANPFGCAGARMYRTGDMACWDEKFRLCFLGRIDNQLKIRGYRIEPGDIENTLMTFPGVKHALVMARDDNVQGQKRLIAWVIASDDACSPEALRSWLEEKLPEYMIPSAIVMLASYPLTANGKIDRRMLPLPTFSQEAADLPVTGIEKKLCQLFADCLDIAPPGINDNFFHLGGHSLLALRLIGQLRAAFNADLSLKTIFDSPTVARLSNAILSAHPSERRLALTAQTRPAVLPMSFAQQRLWLQEQITPGGAYNMPLTLQLTGALNVAALEQALRDVLTRHESLRTLLTEQNGLPCQSIIPIERLPFSLQYQKTNAAQLTSILEQQCGHVFRLGHEIPLKACLYQLAEEQHVLLLLVHHTAGDGGSLAPLMQDLSLAYRSRLRGESPALSPLEIQYADYAIWQRALLEDEQDVNGLFTRQMRYWAEQLSCLPNEVTLTGDRQRPAYPTNAAGRVAFTLTTPVYSRIKALCRQTDASLFMVLQAALATLLHRLGAGSDIVTGTPVLGRTEASQMSMVGYFANTVVLRSNLTENPTFSALIDQVRSCTLAAYEHQDIPFERLVEALSPERSVTRNPLFQIMMMLDTPLPQGVDFPGLTLAMCSPPATTAKFDLLFSFSTDEEKECLCGQIEFTTDLYDTETVSGFARQLCNILAAVTENPEIQVSEFDLLDGQERERLLNTWNNTATELPCATLATLFERQVSRTPDAIAVSEGNNTLTYAALNRAANRLAHKLQALAGGKPFCAGLLMHHSIEEAIAMLAIIKAGGAYLPLRQGDPLERQQMMVDDAGATILIAEPCKGYPAVSNIIVTGADFQAINCSQTNPPACVKPENLAYIMYTSGSTGKPKGIAIDQQSVIALACDRRWLPEDHRRILLHSPAAFDASTYEFWVALMCGGQLVVAPRGELDIDALAKTIVDEKITAVWLTAGLFRLMADVYPGAFANLRLLLAGGDILPKSAIATVLQRCPRLVIMNGYGPTETTTFATTWPINSVPESARVPIGRPLDNMQVYVLDAYLNPVPAGIPGELYIAGAGLAWGYINQQGLTAAHFVANPFSRNGERMYRSGDWVRWRRDGVLEYLNRGDQQIKIRGFRIELAEVESALMEQEEVAQALVALSEPQQGNKQLMAWVIAREDTPCDPAQLRQRLSNSLPDFMVPAAIIPVEHFPLTANGKVDIRALPVPAFSSEHRREARTPRERVLCELFAEVLGIEKPGIDDSFFQLGGHSLLASRLISQVRKTLHVNPGIRDLFEAPTVAQFAEQLAEMAHQKQEALTPQIREPFLPLSCAQQRMWLLDNLDNNHAAYNMPLALRLSGTLDDEALRQALFDLVQRHEILRTTYPLHLDEPCQHILAPEDARPSLEISDIESSTLMAHIDRAAAQPFDLARELPLKGWLFHLEASREHVLLLLVHHIACDGGSLSPLLKDLSTAYQARRINRAPQWAPLPIQYADYALWQRKILGDIQNSTSAGGRQLAFWCEALTGIPPEIDLPADRPRPPSPSFRGERIDFTLDKSLYQQLRQLARAEGVTLFMLLQAGVAVLLNRMGAGYDITLGTGVAGRTDEAMRDLIGFFVNTLVLRVNCASNPTFSELLASVREFMLSAYDHQDVPFDRVVEALNPDRSSSRHPLFQVMLVLQNNSGGEQCFADLPVAPQPVGFVPAKFDLTFNFVERYSGRGEVDALDAQLEYAVDLFDRQTAEMLAQTLQRLLSFIPEAPDTRIMNIPLLADEQRHHLLNGMNDTERDVPFTSLAALFDRQVSEHPDRVAASCRDEQLTYAELDSLASRLARRLLLSGIGPDQGVALLLERSLSLVVSILAVAKAGGFYVPLRTSDPMDRWQHIVRETGAKVAIVDERFRHTALPAELIVEVAGQIDESGDISSPERPVAPHHLAYVMFTSGSTGQPKGIATTQDNVVALALDDRWKDEKGQRILLHSAYAFDASTYELWATLLNGHHAVIVPGDELDLPTLTSTLVDKQVTVAFLTSGLFRLIAEESPQSLAPLRKLYTGGERISGNAVEIVRERWPELALMNIYGPTETTTFVADYLIADSDKPYRDIPIGMAYNNTRLYVLDTFLQPVPIGVPGELYVAGRGLARGYINSPSPTASHFIADPFGPTGSRMYRTGDIVKWRRDGALRFVGRQDQQVKIRGFRIEPGEIESVLTRHPDVLQAMVSPWEDAAGNRQLVAWVVANTHGELPAQLQQYARQHLPDFMVPVAIMLLDKLPLNANGKTSLAALPKPGFSIQTGREPETDNERWLSAKFCELLKVENIGINDSFFSLGGHSLLAARLIARIYEELGVKLSLRDLFESPTVVLLAKNLENGNRSSGLDVMLPLQPLGVNPPLFCLHPGGGLSWSYSGFIPFLGTQQPVYGIQAERLSTGRTPQSIQQMAKVYLTEIYKIQPHGPYSLLGWSFGCHLAHEIATLLQSEKQTVKSLTFMDGYPLWSTFKNSRRTDKDSLRTMFEALTGTVPQDDNALSVSTLRQALTLAGHPLADVEPEVFDRILAEFRDAPGLLADFSPGVYHGDVLFFKAAKAAVDGEDYDPQLWNQYVKGEIVAHSVPCTHDSMLSAEALKTIGPVLKRWITAEVPSSLSR